MFNRRVNITALPVWAFDFSQYKPAAFDDIWAYESDGPSGSLTVIAPQKLKLEATLVSPPEPCKAQIVKTVLIMVGLSKDQLEKVAINNCIQVKSQAGRITRLYLQDVLAYPLTQEVPVNSQVIYMLTTSFLMIMALVFWSTNLRPWSHRPKIIY